MVRRVGIVLGIVCAFLPLGHTARACSCASGDPHAALAAADAAFIGRLTSHDVDRPPDRTIRGGEEVRSHFRVDEIVKGRLGREVVIRGRTGDTCGVGGVAGRRIGLFLTRRGEEWTASLCSQIDPDALRRAAEPLQSPDSVGPASFLVGIVLGDVRIVALDQAGRIVGYGSGHGLPEGLDVCPGSRRVVGTMLEGEPNQYQMVRLVVRDIETLKVVTELRLEELTGTGPGRWWPVAVSCRDSMGSQVFIAGNSDDGRWLRVISLQGQERSVAFDGRGRPPSFSAKRDVAYIGAGKSIVELDVPTGRTRTLMTLPLSPSSVALNTNESALAGTNGSHPPMGRVFTVDLATQKVTIVPGLQGRPVWLDESRFAVLPSEGRVRVYGDSLRVLSSWSGLSNDETAAVGASLYSASGGRVVKASALGGDVRVIRKFDSPEVYAFAYVPAKQPQPSGQQTRTGLRPAVLAVVLALMALVVSFGLSQAAASRRRR